MVCLFCGSEDLHLTNDGRLSWIECLNCGSTGPTYVYNLPGQENHITDGDAIEKTWELYKRKGE